MCDISEAELRIDVYRAAINDSPVSVTITHLPSGVVTSATGVSQLKAKTEAFSRLKETLQTLRECK